MAGCASASVWRHVWEMGSVVKKIRKTGYPVVKNQFDRPTRNGRRRYDQIERMVEGLKALHRTNQ